MSFLNSYISIFNPRFENKKNFLKIFLFFILFSHLASFFLNRLGLKITNNDVIANYQIQKINHNRFKDIDTIFVGDSSLGNSINVKKFKELSKLNSENLSLTGSFGISGSLGIIKKALKKNPNINNFIIVQTLDIWERPFSKEAILELFPLKEMNIYVDKKSIFSFFFNPKEIYWNIKYFFQRKAMNSKLYKIDNHNDYILQGENKYSNQKLFINEGANLNNVIISEGKSKEIEMIDLFCKKNSLNCLFLNGPILKEYIDNSNRFIKYKDDVISKKFNYIKYFPNIFSYESFKMGDSIDHMDKKYKTESTIDIYNVIKDSLIY